jgi:hypothetical protein
VSGLDFLFEGKPPPSVQTYGTTTTGLPKWLSDYTQGLVTKANAIAGEGYQPYEGPRLAGLNEDTQRAFDITRGATGVYTPWIQGAQGALGQVQPMIDKASRTYPQAAQEYMDPYVDNVINRGSQLATRTLNEQFLPGVGRMFGAAGATPRSTQMRRTVDAGVRDLTEGLNAQNQAALSQAYTTGANIFGQDMQRQGALGQLSLDAARTGTDIGGQAQEMALRDAAANAAVGETIQGDQQRSLDLAYEDFARQRDFPRENIDWLSQVIKGTPHETTTTSNQTGPADVVGPSGAAQLGSLLTTGLGAWQAWKDAKGNKRGGRIHARKGALAYA